MYMEYLLGAYRPNSILIFLVFDTTDMKSLPAAVRPKGFIRLACLGKTSIA